MTLFTCVTVSFQDESHFLKNVKTARCRAAMPLLKVSPAESGLESEPTRPGDPIVVCSGWQRVQGEQGLQGGDGGPWMWLRASLLEAVVLDSTSFLPSC